MRSNFCYYCLAGKLYWLLNFWNAFWTLSSARFGEKKKIYFDPFAFASKYTYRQVNYFSLVNKNWKLMI